MLIALSWFVFALLCEPSFGLIFSPISIRSSIHPTYSLRANPNARPISRKASFNIRKENRAELRRPIGPKIPRDPFKREVFKPVLDMNTNARPSRQSLASSSVRQTMRENFRPPSRLISIDERFELSECIVGEKYCGNVFSVKSYGLFVDIGSRIDGLVHVKDVSKDYFITDLTKHFVPGQPVDVWVKFIETQAHATPRLGLQMFAPGDKASNRPYGSLQWEDFHSGCPVCGVVVKVSDFGVYVDVGYSDLAFLHVKKMKQIYRKQRSFKPWEVYPVGSSVSAFVYLMDEERGRLQLTTYSPEEWRYKISTRSTTSQIQDDESAKDADSVLHSMNLGEDDEVVASGDDMNLYDDGDLDQIEDEDEEEGNDAEVYEFSEDEIAAIESRRRERTQQTPVHHMSAPARTLATAQQLPPPAPEDSRTIKLLIDDLNPGTSSEASERMRIPRMEDLDYHPGMRPAAAGVPISSDKLFHLISCGKKFITVRKLMDWQFLQPYIKNGLIDATVLRELVAASGGDCGRLDLANMDNFIGHLETFLQLDPDYGNYELVQAVQDHLQSQRQSPKQSRMESTTISEASEQQQ